ncbi:MAG TPA: glycosyltransferase [Bryobacteraceae bacterium]|jgi:hopene-associated glycosyltransferase HpnB|nr:glycosyltransferase [Bryobacteraceae bacterium]
MLAAVIAAVPVCIWFYLLLGRGGFWRIADKLAPPMRSGIPDRRVVAVVPARNEAPVIAATLASLFVQKLSVVLVDDNSTDDTAAVARREAVRSGCSDQLFIISGRPLPPGWTGKLWAMHQGLERAAALAPDYVLLTDADIVHGHDSVAELVGIAESGRYDLVSYMVKLACVSFAEKALIPAFVFFFFMLYPPAWIASPKSKAAGAAGGCMLLRPEALMNAGGLEVIRSTMIDDCALARIIKRSGGRIWLGLTRSTLSNRYYGDFREIGRMISRTAFHQLKHSWLILAGTVAGLVVTYLLPVILLFSGSALAAAGGALAWLMMSLAYLPMVRFYGRSWLWACALPFIACFYLGATVHSAIQYWRGQGGEWKGRAQDLPTR